MGMNITYFVLPFTFLFAGHTGSILKLNTDYMLYSETYIIVLYLSQAGREKKEILNYDLKVVFGDPPVVAIS